MAGDLFEVMATGGRVGFETVAWFNGGLFDDSTALPLEKSDIETVLAASDLDWSEIDPSILGMLFERGLDPGKRAQLGAHYTDRDKIILLAGIYASDPVPEPRLANLRGEDADEWACLASHDETELSTGRPVLSAAEVGDSIAGCRCFASLPQARCGCATSTLVSGLRRWSSTDRLWSSRRNRDG